MLHDKVTQLLLVVEVPPSLCWFQLITQLSGCAQLTFCLHLLQLVLPMSACLERVTTAVYKTVDQPLNVQNVLHFHNVLA
jgi:hypothetical protein